MERCPDCMSVCPWCGNRRWQTRENGCGAITGNKSKACKKSKRLAGVPCPTCGSSKVEEGVVAERTTA